MAPVAAILFIVFPRKPAIVRAPALRTAIPLAIANMRGSAGRGDTCKSVASRDEPASDETTYQANTNSLPRGYHSSHFGLHIIIKATRLGEG